MYFASQKHLKGNVKPGISSLLFRMTWQQPMNPAKAPNVTEFSPTQHNPKKP